MRPSDVADLLKTFAVDVRGFVATLIEPIGAKQAEMEARIALIPTEKVEPGPAGASAFDLACVAGFTGTEDEWLASLHGIQGESVQGERGKDGSSVTLDDVRPLVKQAVAEALLSDDAHTLVGSALQSLTEAISAKFASADHAG